MGNGHPGRATGRERENGAGRERAAARCRPTDPRARIVHHGRNTFPFADLGQAQSNRVANGGGYNDPPPTFGSGGSIASNADRRRCETVSSADFTRQIAGAWSYAGP